MFRVSLPALVFFMIVLFLFVHGCDDDDDVIHPLPQCEQPILTIGPIVEVDTFQVNITYGTDVLTRGRVDYSYKDQNYYLTSYPDTMHTFTITRLNYGNFQSFEYKFTIPQTNCSTTGSGEYLNPRHPSEDVDEGWQHFNMGNFSQALALFDMAVSKDRSYIPGREGRGWTLFALQDYQGARTDFKTVLYLTDNEYAPDIYAGLALAISVVDPQGDQNDRSGHSATELATEVFNNDPKWVCPHNPELDFRDIILVLAQVYFVRADYNLSLQWLQEFDPAITLDPLTNEGISQLAELLEYYSDLYG